MVCSTFIAHLLLVDEKVFGHSGRWRVPPRQLYFNGCKVEAPKGLSLNTVYTINEIPNK
jgi:hypothetical protein